MKSDKRDHDYSDAQTVAGRPVVQTIARPVPLNNNASLLRSEDARPPLATRERSITRVKNINELKNVTPRVKLVSPEVSSLTRLTTKMSVPAQNLPEGRAPSADASRQALKNYCRTCAGLKLPLVDIFSEKGMQMRLNQQMKHLEEINQQDSLSTQMCMDCICDLKMSYKFFMQIKKAQVKLQSIHSSFQPTAANAARLSESERSDASSRIPSTNRRTTCPSRKSETEKSEISTRLSSPSTIETGADNSKSDRPSDPQPQKKIETETEDEPAFRQSDDNDSIEEFDPDDPSCQPDTSDAADSDDEFVAETSENSQNVKTRDIQSMDRSTRESTNVIEENPPISSVPKPDEKSEPKKDSCKTVYQYDTALKAYVKVESTENNDRTNTSLIKPKLERDRSIDCAREVAKHPNILKRKIPARKDFLGNPVTSVCTSDSTFVRSGQKDTKKPKLNVENALNITNENEDGIMYVTVKGTKPNELLLVKVKKMDKPEGSKREEKKKSLDGVPVEKILKKLEPFTVKDKDFTIERSKALDIREQIIEEQIEEYKKKREKVLGGTASLPNALKFEDGLIRFVNPVDSGADGGVRIKVEPSDEVEDIRRVVGSREDRDEEPDRSDSAGYDNTGEYLSRLARLKRKWEEAKRKKELLQRELDQSYTEGNMEKLARILGEKEKNLQDFQDYLKQRKIVITRLKDEDIISLYEDRNNTCLQRNFPDLIDESTPSDYIEMQNYLECDYCPETFAHRDVLEEHLKSHDYKLMYYCEDCQAEFSTIKLKRSHNVTCMKKLICKYCDLMLDSKGKKRQHEQKHVDSMYGQLCDVCGEKFKHQGTLDQHFKTQHMTWEKIYQCPKCPKKFAFKQKLSFHLKSVHTTLRAFLCEDCGADFKNPASLRHHRIRKHQPTGNKRECPVCNKLVPFYSLSKHMYTHKAYTIQCPNCDKMFKNSSTLKQHVRIHEDQRQYRCDTCGVGFNRRDGLRLHMRVHQKSDSRALKECSCQVCSEKFPNHSMLVIHRNRVHKDGRQYTCHICNRSMLSTRSLEWHMSHIHNEVLPGGPRDDSDKVPEKKRVSCVHCDKTFKTEMILRTHIKNTHMEKDPTKCLDCDLTFTSDVRLRHHMMVAHNRLEGTLSCPHCSKRFVNQLRLKTHMISHSEDRPYTCEICGFNLKTKIQLIKHHQNRHSDERPLQCRYCPWRCKQVSALVCHERTHTNERPYSCSVCRQRFKYLGDKNKHERRHEILGGSGFKRIVAGRNLKTPKIQLEETSTSEQDQIEYENPEDEEQLEQRYEEEEEHQYEEQQDGEYDGDKFNEQEIVKFEEENIGEDYEQTYEQVRIRRSHERDLNTELSCTYSTDKYLVFQVLFST